MEPHKEFTLDDLNIVLYHLYDGTKIIGEEIMSDYLSGVNVVYAPLEFHVRSDGKFETTSLTPYIPENVDVETTFNESSILSKSFVGNSLKMKYYNCLLVFLKNLSEHPSSSSLSDYPNIPSDLTGGNFKIDDDDDDDTGGFGNFQRN